MTKMNYPKKNGDDKKHDARKKFRMQRKE